MIAPETVLGAAGLVMLAGRVATATTEGRLRAAGWPMWRCGPAVWGLLLHDVLLGAVVLGLLGGGGLWVADLSMLDDGRASIVVVGAAAVALPAASALLRRRRGLDLRAMLGLNRTAAEPRSTLRSRLLAALERHGVRKAGHWIDAGVERCLRRSGMEADQLLPGLWPAVRLRLREVPGTPRTEVALLMLQAQSIMDDAAPARERMLTLLHLVYARAGRSAVRAALEQARRSPVGSGRPGARAIGAGAVPVAPVG